MRPKKWFFFAVHGIVLLYIFGAFIVKNLLENVVQNA